jgi:tetratricopeptide (TPR) repeat protein
MNQARVTGDAAFYARAEAACDRALRLAPDHYDALRLRAWIYGGEHRFAEAAAAARRAHALRPSDPFNFGTLGDALVELGDYDGAGAAFQSMIDLRPDSASYARGAYLRELEGDVDGALALMTLAAHAADPSQRAWYRSQLGDLEFSRGNAEGAAREQAAALAEAPRAHAALAGLARAEAALGNPKRAVSLYRQSLEVFPSPMVAAELGELLEVLGRKDEAAQQFALIEATRRLQAGSGLFDRQIAVIHADRGVDPDDAWRIAERSLESRRDIYGYDAVAWCALASGRLARARETIGYALKLGTKDARLLYHAGMIAAAAGDRAEGRCLLAQALRINPYFDLRSAAIARRRLEELS